MIAARRGGGRADSDMRVFGIGPKGAFLIYFQGGVVRLEFSSNIMIWYVITSRAANGSSRCGGGGGGDVGLPGAFLCC